MIIFYLNKHEKILKSDFDLHIHAHNSSENYCTLNISYQNKEVNHIWQN